jgi:hypothetical protein
MKRSIKLFMWGYQEHFARSLSRRGEQVFEELGIQLKPDVMLVGILKVDVEDRHPVCVEPEDGKWSLSLFADLPERYEETIKTHPLNRMFYDHEPTRRDKPENIRRSSATMVVRDSLQGFDREHGVRSFFGAARPVDDYYVIPVIQIAKSLFEQFPPLILPDTGDEFHPSGEKSLIHACLGVLLEEASRDLLSTDPGRSGSSTMRNAKEIIAEGAENFMRIPDLLTAPNPYSSGDLFQRLNIVSSLFYEGKEGLGRLILVRPENPSIEYLVGFETPVPLRQPRWARKILQMASADVALIVSESKIYGLGRLGLDHDYSALDAFTIDFLDHYQWELRCGDLRLMYSRYREPRLPQEPISREQFQSNVLRVFTKASQANAESLWTLFRTCVKMSHGSMLVVAEDAASESVRLADQGTPIRPVVMTEEMLERVSGIDGSILIDPSGVCHAIGVILDGEATGNCSPARGSRYNSALRYVNAAASRRLAIVVSDDRTVDIVPLLRPQMRRREIEKHIVDLENAPVDAYHSAQNWLDEHRFYINEEQCSRINSALDRLNGLAREVGEIRYITTHFQADPDLNDSYFFQ